MLWVTKGYATVEAVEATDHAAAVAKKSGAIAQLLFWLVLRGFNTMFSGDLTGASALADQALELAPREGNSASLGSAYNLKMQTGCFRGDLNGAEEHFANGLPFFGDPDLKQLPGTAQTAVFGVASWNAWMLGRIGLARKRITEMLEMVNMSNPFEEAVSCVFSALLQIFLRDYEAAERRAVRAFELSERHQFQQLGGNARIFLGYARAQLGHVDEGTALIRQGLSELVQTGVHLMRGQLMLFLAAAQEREGMTDDALATIDQAIKANSEEDVWRPEILRLRGELQLKLGLVELAEADFREALTLARSMSAKSWELRATMSLARLLRYMGRGEEAHAMLAEIYNWFTEGFDTGDLKAAKALLDELAT